MHGDDRFFGENIAADYDESSADMFPADVVEPAVDVPAELAADGPARPAAGLGPGAEH